MDEKEKNAAENKNSPKLTDEQIKENEEKIWDMKQELEDYLEEQGMYLRQ